MSEPVHVAILGASGYGAGELMRLLTQHPHARVVCATSSSQAGERIDRLHPHLRGFYDLHAAASLDTGTLLDAPAAVVISALPHGKSAAALVELEESLARRSGHERVRYIDLSGDLRLRDLAEHKRFYAESPPLETWRESAVYGLPELYREQVRTARRIANPGCLASAAILAAAPLCAAGLAGTLFIDAKTGSSGSGRTLKETTHHPTRHADFRAYKALAHQHEPEVAQILGDLAGRRPETTFVAQSMDAARGIFVTVHAHMKRELDAADPLSQYRDFYAASPFVRIVDDSPALQNVAGSNFCDIGLACRGKQVIVMAALDNLVKGMAGTAIQNLNLMCGLPETAGLWSPSLRPV